MAHQSTEQLDAGLDHVRASPPDDGVVELIVLRPAVDERLVVEEAEVSTGVGLVGDTWHERPSSRTPDGGPHPGKQVTLVNARLTALIAPDGLDQRVLAGDQLHVDLDLSEDNLPAGTRLAVGSAVLEVSDAPHTGCAKFAARFGKAALRFVNVGPGRDLRLRGINARVVQPGRIRTGDRVRRVVPGGR